MNLLDYLKNSKANFDRIREDQKKRSLTAQLGRAASAIIPDPIEQKIGNALSPIFSSAKESLRKSAITAASQLPVVGPAVNLTSKAKEQAPAIKQALLSPTIQSFAQKQAQESQRLKSEGRPIAAALQPEFQGARAALELTGVPSLARMSVGLGSQALQDITGKSNNPLNKNPLSQVLNPNYSDVTVPKNIGAELLFGRGSFQTPFTEAQQGGALSSQLAQAGKPKTAAATLFGLPLLQAISVDPGFSPGKEAKNIAEQAAKESGFDAAKYVAEQTAKRKAAEVTGNPTIVDKIRNFGNTARQTLADSTVPLTDPLMSYEKKTGAKILPEKDVRFQIDRVLRADTLANQFIKDSGIEKIIQDVPNMDEFDQYLIARQSADVAKAGITTGRDLAKDAELVKTLAPTYEPYAAQVTQYSHNILDYITRSGLISKEASDALKIQFPNYVPLNRVFSEVEQAIGEGVGKTTSGMTNLSKQTVVQKLKGSEREIQNPLQSLIEKTYDAYRQGERNKAGTMLADYMDLEGNPFDIRPLRTEPKIDVASDKGTFSILRNGVKEVYEVPPEIAAAAKSLKVQQMDTLLKILAIPNRIFKTGTTGINIPFVLANSIKDLWTSINLSPSATNTVLNPFVFLKGLTSALKHDELFDRAMRDAALQTSFDISRNQAKKTLESIRSGRGVGSKIKFIATHPGELFRAVEDVIGRSEELSRLIQYEGMSRKLLKEGATPERAGILAADAARSTTANFARRGTWGNVLGAILPYFNSSIQGSRSLVKAMKERPAQTSAMIATSLFLPVASATVWNLSDPKRRAVYLGDPNIPGSGIQDFEKENNIIIIPPNPTQDEKGLWNIIKIPMPAGLSSLTIPLRKALEGLSGSDPVGFGDLAQGLLGAVSPINLDINSSDPISTKFGRAVTNIVPQAIKPSVEAMTNTNLFTGRKQVPTSMEKLPPELQVKDYTSGTARLVGNKLGVSPIKTEEFIKGTFGQVGMQGLNIVDSLLAAKGVIPKEQIGGKSINENIIGRFGKAYGGTQESNAFADVQKYMNQEDIASAKLKAEAEKLDTNLLALPRDEANRQVSELKKTNPQLAAKLDDVITERKLGLSSLDKSIKSLGVTSGARAQYIFDELQKLPNDEERAKRFDEYVKKKIITKEVSRQIHMLKAQ